MFIVTLKYILRMNFNENFVYLSPYKVFTFIERKLKINNSSFINNCIIFYHKDFFFFLLLLMILVSLLMLFACDDKY